MINRVWPFGRVDRPFERTGPVAGAFFEGWLLEAERGFTGIVKNRSSLTYNLFTRTGRCLLIIRPDLRKKE